MGKTLWHVWVLGALLPLPGSSSGPHDYSVVSVPCPIPMLQIRDAKSGLSEAELEYIGNRKHNTIPAMQKLLKSIDIAGFDVDGYFKSYSDHLPNIGLAFSGGGYRAMLNGAGAIKAFDVREPDSKILGGLLQSSTYLAGLSGGSWLLSSVFYNNFSTISGLQERGPIWNLTGPVYEPLTSSSWEGIAEMFKYFGSEVFWGKMFHLYPVSIVDIWGRVLSQRFFGNDSGVGHGDFGVNLTLSGLKTQLPLLAGEVPLPILVAESRINDQDWWILDNTTVFEISPFEFGSWDPTIHAFVDTEYIGSTFSNGAVQYGQCSEGFDQAGFVAGISSDIFSSLFAELIPPALLRYLDEIPGFSWIYKFLNGGFLTAEIGPNPWYNWQSSAGSKGVNSSDLTDEVLHLVDGGTDGQNIPFEPLIEPARAVDMIVAIDSSADDNNWPDGSALIASYKRSSLAIGRGVSFPAVPDNNTFLNLGLTRRPVFFGCNETASPLIVLISNAPYTAFSNVPTYYASYSWTDRDAMIENGGLAATFGNGTGSQEYKVCLGCAILSRSFSKTNFTPPAACTKCFQAYCWSGATDTNTPDPHWNDNLIGFAPAGLGVDVSRAAVVDTSSFVVQEDRRDDL